ncbi:MAG: hypothetical protein PHN49_08700, partial [Candidatus Omnitrophica bacterium]|nr:hypothetical protein [Candidatus Omnitrophota bacterium]
IGVRGTIVAGQVDGMHSFVALMGPGDGNNAGANQGSIVLSNVVNGQTVEETVNRTGYGSVIDGVGSAPSAAFQVPAEQMNNLVSTFSPGPSDQSSGASGPGGNAGSASSDINVGSVSAAGGENTFAALGTVNDLASLEETISTIGSETDPARQNIANDSFTNTSGSTGGNPESPGSTPVGYYEQQYVAFTGGDGVGQYNIYLEISNNSFGGPNSYIESVPITCFIYGTPTNFHYDIPDTPFAELDPATHKKTFSSLTDSDTSDMVTPNPATINITFPQDPATQGTPTSVNHDVTVWVATYAVFNDNTGGDDAPLTTI